MPQLQVHTRAPSHKYEIIIGTGILSEAGRIIRRRLGERSQRIVAISNKTVFSLYGADLVKNLEAEGFCVTPRLIGDGEQFKSMRTVEGLLRFLSQNGVERSDSVIALGGGVVGDVAGFAAAVYLRGIRFIQIPTTLLAQVDSSVGGKTGVNLPAGKNLVGSFYPPAAVIIDIQALATLPARELVAGWCECVKQGALSGRKLLKQTSDFLKEVNSRQVRISQKLERLIASHCAFKMSIVEGDEREDFNRRDGRSRRILNFGHTVAHALEAVTNYRRFRHGEAVGHGMLVAAELSKNLGLLPPSELELLSQAVTLCGPLPSARDLDRSAVIRAVTQDKKRTAGQVQWVLLERIGRPRIVDGKEISPQLLRRSLRDALR